MLTLSGDDPGCASRGVRRKVSLHEVPLRGGGLMRSEGLGNRGCRGARIVGGPSIETMATARRGRPSYGSIRKCARSGFRSASSRKIIGWGRRGEALRWGKHGVQLEHGPDRGGWRDMECREYGRRV